MLLISCFGTYFSFVLHVNLNFFRRNVKDSLKKKKKYPREIDQFLNQYHSGTSDPWKKGSVTYKKSLERHPQLASLRNHSRHVEGPSTFSCVIITNSPYAVAPSLFLSLLFSAVCLLMSVPRGNITYVPQRDFFLQVVIYFGVFFFFFNSVFKRNTRKHVSWGGEYRILFPQARKRTILTDHVYILTIYCKHT